MARHAAARYADRLDAGRRLAPLLRRYAGRGDVVVLGVPRGGVVVAAPVAAALGAPLDVVVVRKLGMPGRPELAMAAITEVGGTVGVVRNEDVLHRWQVPEEAVAAVLDAELAELRRRQDVYRGARPPLAVAGRTAVVVDDGLATGASMRAAVAALRQLDAGAVVVGVPVGGERTCRELALLADDVVCAWTPRPFEAVGQAYDDFTPIPDEDVLAALGL